MSQPLLTLKNTPTLDLQIRLFCDAEGSNLAPNDLDGSHGERTRLIPKLSLRAGEPFGIRLLPWLRHSPTLD